MRRIMIVGSPGAGKTTLAKALGQALGLPTYHLDEIHHYRDHSLKRKVQVMDELRPILALGGYILEGGYGHTYAARLAACDTLIWLDLPLLRRCWRIWCRERAERRNASAATQPPPVPWLHVLRDNHAMRIAQTRLLSRVPPGVSALHLRSPAEVRDFLDRCLQSVAPK